MRERWTKTRVLSWLREEDPHELEALFRRADTVRQENVGDEVHLRGLIEISNFCVRQCAYCGIRLGNRSVDRYRMTATEIWKCVKKAKALHYGTVVFQSGEDYGIRAEWLASIIRHIKKETELAVTLSLGERPLKDLQAWRKAGADRYLLRFETSDRDLYRRIHPDRRGILSNRMADLKKLRALGYEVGSGVMVGIPRQTYSTLADDLFWFRKLDLDMVGIGPFISHPATPLGAAKAATSRDQVPATEQMVYKVVALTRILRPDANIPSTTALATINRKRGRELGLMRGANVVMPNLTPLKYRERYEIYPGKACVNETADQCAGCLTGRIRSIGRTVGKGQGCRPKKGRKGYSRAHGG